ncbi:SctD family type III secretion system inner membrane ring subunit YscD [Yersinia enterocolitica]|uniref:SctD family type III secretion system inner membrane ring subunit YscD n=1 Tax=Yersinia enterocolitica TaxID=630 RepID=UPI003394851F
MSWVCRFYQGKHRGVEVELPHGRCVFGSDPLQSDIVLSDSEIAPVHLVLMVDEEGIRLTDSAESLLQEGLPVPLGTLLRAGTCLEVGFLLWTFVAVGQPLPETLQVPTQRKEPTDRLPRSRLGVGLGVLSLLLLLTFLGMLGHGLWREYNQDGQLVEQEVRRLLATAAYKDVVLTSPKEGEPWLLTGYIQDNHARLSLQNFLESHGIPFRLELRSMEELRQGAEFILQRLGYHGIEVSLAPQAGWLQLNGEVSEEIQKQKIDSLLQAEVPGLLGVENKVRIAGNQRKRLDALLEQFGLDSDFTVNVKGELIELRGQVNDEKLSSFNQLQQTFRQEFGNRPKLELVNVGGQPQHDELNFEVQAISLGKVPYVVLDNHQRYPEGAILNNGVRILAIRRDAVIVSKGKREFVIQLNGGKPR